MAKKGKGKKKSPAVAADFKIHVDESCLSDSAEMPSDRTMSSEAAVHHEPDTEVVKAVVDLDNTTINHDHQPEGPKDEIQDLIDELSQAEGTDHAEEAEEYGKTVEVVTRQEELEPESLEDLVTGEEAMRPHDDVEFRPEETEEPVDDTLLDEETISEEGAQSPDENIEPLAEDITDTPGESHDLEENQIPTDVKVEDTQKAVEEQEEVQFGREEEDAVLGTKPLVEEEKANPEELRGQHEEQETVPQAEHDKDSVPSENADKISPNNEGETEGSHNESLLHDEDQSLVYDNPGNSETSEPVETGHDYEQRQVEGVETNATNAAKDDENLDHDEHDQSELQYTDDGTDYDGSYLHDGDLATEDEEQTRMERAEALIQAAARAVVASIEQDDYNESSILSTQTDDSYDQSASELTYDEGTELTYGDQSDLTHDGNDEGTCDTETEHQSVHDEGDSSSHHDGDIEDDVFSHNSGQSKRSSMNSSDGLHSGEEAYQEKRLTTPQVGEEAATEEPLSRIPSATSYRETTPHTPGTSKILSRPPFRTPSSVRAMQMSSPAQSLYGSPHSTKRHNPSASRLGTPSRRGSDFSRSHFSPTSSRTKTPTRVFKTRVEHPLVLLHVTVLPLQFQYADAMNLLDEDIPVDLSGVKDSWRLLQEKLGEQVLARGILLSHPQESYEVLEERLLETLDLPVRPRARILKCGHYMGPDEYDSSAGDISDSEEYDGSRRRDRGWCDICGRNVQFEQNDFDSADRKFRVKVFASNGLMKAGAWAACWKEMERVDVEIEPYVEPYLLPDLERLQIEHATPRVHEEFAAEPEAHDDLSHSAEEEVLRRHQEGVEQEALRKKASEERLREIYGHSHTQEEPPQVTPEPGQESRSQSRSSIRDETLLELLLAAFKVAMRDRKNVMICILSVLVLLLALRPRGPPVPLHSSHPNAPNQVHDIAQGTMQEAIPKPLEVVAERPGSANKVLEDQPLPKVKKIVKVNKPIMKPEVVGRKIAEPPVSEEVEEVDEYDHADYTEDAFVDEIFPAMEEVELEKSSSQGEVYHLEPLEAQFDPEPEPVDQEHYHIEPPTPKKVTRKPAAASKKVARSGNGVEIAGGQKRKT
ncbi:hypothetical protein BP6252_06145 [Coleophoma cylindrospora]|uniref:Pathway-specific nitrogen regulator n=1 Tax=Coleophoma cylindrospora TaxID=1849047 RepID=A0A3D8RLU1_9HELO|nr:hypothetical protein BP6252_06145 [Coleophoma cylindrospora]